MQECDFDTMGENIHQLTSLPYSNFEDEQSEDADGQPDHVPNLHVENVTSSGRKPGLTEKFHKLTKEKKITIVLASLLVILSIFTIVYASVEKHRKPLEDLLAKCEAVEKYKRIDAGLNLTKSRRQCLNRGACWDATALGSPNCFYPFSNHRGYRVLETSTVKESGMELDLERLDKLNPLFKDEAKSLKCIISYETDSRLRVKIFNPNEDRYEVPMNSHHDVSGHRMQYILSITREMFGFSVSRTHEATSTIFNTTVEGFIFSDQLLQLNMALSSSNVYGLSGDHKDGLLRTMEFNYQSVWATSVEKRHGAHPFLLHVEKDGHASGFFLQNSNAMDVILNPYPAITFRTTGGILDFYIFLGPTPAEVMRQFADKIGKPFLPPLWALGYHFGSESFNNDQDIQAIVKSSIPLDGVWVGKSTLENDQEFSLDTARFPNISDIVSDLHVKNKLLLVHTRPAILLNSSLYEEDATNFVRDSSNKTIVAKVLGGDAVIPDYFHPDTSGWLENILTDYRSKLQFDGMLLDENEPTTVSNGAVGGCSTTDPYDNSIYSLKNVRRLQTKTLCPSARHHGGLRHYDVHNICGWRSSAVTKAAMSNVITDKRAVLLSRSTYLGSGVHTGHFIKENAATWEDMAHSIVAMLNYNMYGIPLVGANICGHKSGVNADDQSTEEEMCVRWHQLATFYPFAKRYPAVETEMLKFSNDSVARIKEAVEMRYRMLPTLYTLFYSAHTRGLPVVSPIFFDYLDDVNTLPIQDQFMFGSGIMVAPVLQPGVTSHKVYFPKDLWYDYYNPNNVIDGVTEPGYAEQNVTLDKQTYYARGGHIIVTHFNTFTTTKEMNEKGDYVLDVYLSSAGQSFGELYSDDGVSQHTISHDQFLYVKFNATQEFLRSEVTLRFPGHNNENKIKEINVRGLTNHTKQVTVNNSEDEWSDFTFKALSDTSISPSSDTDLSESDAEFDSRINLNIEPSPSVKNLSTKPKPPAVLEPYPEVDPNHDLNSDLKPNPAFLGYELSAKSKTLSNSESDKDDSTDEEPGKIKPVRVKRRKSSSERRRSQPELDLITPGEDSEDELVGSHFKAGYKLTPRSSISSSQVAIPKPEAPSAKPLNSEEPCAVTLNLEEPSTTTLNSDEPGTAILNSEEPGTATLNLEKPSTTNLNLEEPNTTTLNLEEPSTTTLNLEEPNTTTLNLEEPSTTTLNLEEPSTAILNLEEPSTAILNLEEPSATTLNLEEPSTTTLNLEEPSATTLNLEKPSTTTLNFEELSATTLNFEELSAATLNLDEPVDLDHSLEAFLESETEDMLIEVDKHEPVYPAQQVVTTPEIKCEEEPVVRSLDFKLKEESDIEYEEGFIEKCGDKRKEDKDRIEEDQVEDEGNTMKPIKVETRDVSRSLVLSASHQTDHYVEGDSGDSPLRTEHSMVEVGRDGKIVKKESSPFKYAEQVPCSSSPNKELTEEGLKAEIRGLQEEMAKSDLIIAELNITIEDLREYNTKLEHDIFSKEASRSQEAKQLDFEQSDEWLNLEIEVARLQKEVTERDSIIRTQKDALDRTLSKGGSPRQVSLAGAARQALDINVSEMAKKYNEALILCKNTHTSDTSGEGEHDNSELFEQRLRELERNNYQFIEELGVRHTEEMERLRSDYEVLLELAVKEKENEMRNTIIENEELEDLAGQVEDLTQSMMDKEKEIKRQQVTISNLMDEIKLLKDKKASVPMPLPQIIIEDPEGEVQCSECCKKSGEIKKLKENIEEAKSDFKEYCSTTLKGFSDADCCIKDLKKVNVDVKNDLNSMKSELANFSAEIKDAFSALELETTKHSTEPIPLVNCSTQTEAQPKSRVLPQPNVSKDSSCSEASEPADLSSCREAQTSTSNLSSVEDRGFKEKEAKYKKDIFDLKVKLKELEVKMNHIKKKADEMKNDSKDQTLSENLSNDKLMDLVREKDRALQQARRLHGANVATMRKRHDKAVGNLQATIDQLTVTLQQFVPGHHTGTIR
ncbi:hypothetical protein ACHWQZ_G013739 [Mnemiopsis leidyi]